MESEHGNFVNINMIPRTIDDLKRKEKSIQLFKQEFINYFDNFILL